MEADPIATGPRAPLSLSRSTRERLERLGLEFLAEVLRRDTRRHAENVPALAELAHVLTRLGRVEEGLRTDLALVRLVPQDPTVHYNLACSYALLGEVESALDALEAAVSHGYDDVEHLATDADLETLHDEERYRRILRTLERT